MPILVIGCALIFLLRIWGSRVATEKLIAIITLILFVIWLIWVLGLIEIPARLTGVAR